MKLVQHGITFARQRGWPVTVSAAVMGVCLFRSIGFEELATMQIRIEGEKEMIQLVMMELPAARQS